MRRILSVIALGMWITLACVGSAHADDVEQAEALNAEGKKLVRRLDLEGAAERFRDAWQLIRDPRYAFNLCYTLEKSGQYAQARIACNEVEMAEDQRLAGKAKELKASIEKKMAAQPGAGLPEQPVSTQPVSTQPGSPPVGPPVAGQVPPTNQPRPPMMVQPGVQPRYPAGGYPQTAYLAPPQKRTTSYMSHVLLADVASWTVLLLSAGAESGELTGLGVTGLLLGAPVVHMAHGNNRGALLSVVSRAGMPLGGALLFSSSCDGFDCVGTAVGGAVLGYGGAVLLDWLVFAKKDEYIYPNQGLVMPTLELRRGGAVAGLSLQL